MSLLSELLASPVTSLRTRFLAPAAVLPEGLVEALAADPRQAARALAQQLRKRHDAERAEAQRLREMLRFERALWEEGKTHLAGVDEAGMAPLAGPVVAAAVVLPLNYQLPGLDDSKKVHNPQRREALALAVKWDAVAWAVGMAEVEEIDRLNIYHAGLLAMRRAVEGLSVQPDFVLVDARHIPNCPYPQRGIIQGDALSLSIAAASVVAKTTRDARMAELDQTYPGYGLATHKGYPTPEHCRRLEALGASPIHRRSFEPVRKVLGLGPEALEAFHRRSGPA